MDLILKRISPTIQDTIGDLYDENRKFFCNTLEDEYREVKVRKETRIWAGRYRLGIQKALTKLTQKYLDDTRIPFFERHIEIKNVPQFTGVYIHIGNHEKHTDACVLVGEWLNKEERKIANSVATYTRFYKKYYPLLKSGIEIYLNVLDEQTSM